MSDKWCSLHNNGSGAYVSSSEFPVRRDRQGQDGKPVLHTYCRACKSQYENYRRSLQAMRKMQKRQEEEAAVAGRNILLHVDDGLDLEFRTTEGELWIRDQSSGDAYAVIDTPTKRQIIVLLGGLVVPED